MSIKNKVFTKKSVLVDIKIWLGMIHISVPNLAILLYVFDKEYPN